ncbi:hypothetical protein ACN28I_06590 [Archangium gephyra]
MARVCRTRALTGRTTSAAAASDINPTTPSSTSPVAVRFHRSA